MRGLLAAHPPPSEPSDKTALMCALRLAEATRTGLPAMAAALRELWQAKQLREDEVGGGLGGLGRELQQGKVGSWLHLDSKLQPQEQANGH